MYVGSYVTIILRQRSVSGFINMHNVHSLIPYSSKFSWSNIFMIFVNYTEIMKIFAMKISLQYP